MVKCPFAAKGCNYPEGDCPGHCLVDNGLRQDPFEALRLADALDVVWAGGIAPEAAAELRRLHAENEDFRATCDHLTRENAEQIGEIVALKEQRDELLNAVLFMLSNHCNHISRYDVNAVRAAIAKATQGETK